MKNNQNRQSPNFTKNNPINKFSPNHTSLKENSWVISKNLRLDLGTPLQPHTIKQKLFDKPSQSRPYERFIPTKIALTGVDPSGNINEFISNDIIRPLQRPDIYYKTFTIQNNDNDKNRENNFKRWALNTTVKCNEFKSLPKLQPFTSYYFPPKYNNKDIKKYRNFSLKTDHIGIQVPRSEKVLPVKSFIKLKSDFYFNTETKKENEWIPFTSKNSLNNISSQNYNIINFKPLDKNNNLHLLNKNLYNKKKGIGELADLTKTFRVNFNKEFANKFRENPLRFRIYNGIFSDMYDSSHKNGDIVPPFGKKKNKL